MLIFQHFIALLKTFDCLFSGLKKTHPTHHIQTTNSSVAGRGNEHLTRPNFHMGSSLKGIAQSITSHALSVFRSSSDRERENFFFFYYPLNTFYLRLYGIGHMVKDDSDSEKGNPLPPHRLLLSINSKGSLICTIPQTG